MGPEFFKPTPIGRVAAVLSRTARGFQHFHVLFVEFRRQTMGRLCLGNLAHLFLEHDRVAVGRRLIGMARFFDEEIADAFTPSAVQDRP